MKNTIKLTLAFIVLVSLSIPAFAETIKKDYELGPGTANSGSLSRFFHVPSKLGVTARIRFRRNGPRNTTNTNFDVPLIIQLVQPGTGNDADGPLAVPQKSSIALFDEDEDPDTFPGETITLSGIGNDNGCSGSPWKVRFIYMEDNRPYNNFSVIGEAVITYNGAERPVEVEGGLISLNKGNSVTKNVGSSSGFGQGNIKVTGTWLHSLGNLVPGPLPLKLKFDLIKPNGSTADDETAYQTNEPNGDPDMFFTYHVLSTTSGRWKLKITNNTDHDVMNINPRIKFDPRCFEQ